MKNINRITFPWTLILNLGLGANRVHLTIEIKLVFLFILYWKLIIKSEQKIE